jgi:starch synthase
MKILIVSSEVEPFSKTGGLADVAGILPYAIKEVSDCDIRVISPFYRMVKKREFKIAKIKDINDAPGFDNSVSFKLLGTKFWDIKFYFIRRDEYFDRDDLYGTSQDDYADDAERFSFFCRAVIATMINIGFIPDIIHINDWQTALIPLYRNANLKKDHPLQKSKILFTIHNLAYQGCFSKDVIKKLNLPHRLLKSLVHQDKISFIKCGILYSDAISTVSKKYAEEILTPEYGCGLDNILRDRETELYGILNGVDYSAWNPETDLLIPENYGIHTLEKKLTCKTELLKLMKLTLPVTAPLLGSVGRLAEQKGIDIIIDSIKEIVKFGAGFVILGAGDRRYEDALRHIASEMAGEIGVSINFDNKLAHMIEAGADIFVMPSKYEPCGLNQMYSLRYGTIPVVRATGGLDDTIIDYSLNPQEGNGFKFDHAVKSEFIKAIQRAIEVFNRKEEWQVLQKKVMKLDFSWQRAAREYMTLYEKIINKNR